MVGDEVVNLKFEFGLLLEKRKRLEQITYQSYLTNDKIQ